MTWGPVEDFGGPAAGQRLLTSAFEGLSAGVLLVDAQGRILAANPRAEELLGRRATAMAGRDAHDLLHRGPDGAVIPRAQCVLLAVAEYGRPAWGDSDTFLTGDGRALPVRWSAAPVVHAGRTVGLAVLFADMAGSSAPVGREAARVDLLEDLTEQLTLVSAITEVLSETLDVEEAVGRLGPLLVPKLADWVAVDLRTPEGEVRRVAVLGPQGRDTALEAWRGPLPPPTNLSRSALVRVLHGAQPVLLGPHEMAEPPDAPLAAVQAGFLRVLGATSAAVVPLTSAREVTGAITAVRTRPDRPSPTANSRCSRTSATGRASPSTTPGCSGSSATSPPPCSATCSPSFRRAGACSWPPGTGPPRPARGSAATGTTRSNSGRAAPRW
ncbi:hypothetical protein GCM10010495_59990 [Kitasatospora herbaricolor]|uniref:PAS domain-containing protein n=1 Tax=Kitasatospora herbaricolor TaxID=68217 RepID=UPI00174E2EA4|nr:PAS domain-containing protein [Kitasatospora herbaricolor]MDQ0312679.1 PAS domain S-box-containing protein [Kitasatospora herbaricolor]GGV35048.1 hypothetical protein GCM10010495_59990 [Kitasatospora herbaricolor]